MDRVERLHELVANLTNQLALTQYRLALAQNETEQAARDQMRVPLATYFAVLKGVLPDELTDGDLNQIETTMDKLIASSRVRRPIN